MDTWWAARLVAERELRAQIRTKSFWITFGMMVVGLAAAGILPGLFGGDGTPTVATVGAEADRVVAEAGLEARPAEDRTAAEELVRAGDVTAAVVPDPAGVRVIGLTDPPAEVVAALSESPPVDLLEPSQVGDRARFLVTFGFALVFFAFSMFGVAIAQSVVTEKQTRIVEILVATVPVRALLAGKIAAYSLLVFGQVAVLALVTPLVLRAGEQGPLLGMLGEALGWFVPFFVLGFVLLATMWAVAGAVVSRMEDLGSSTGLVVALVMLPYFGVIFLHGHELGMRVLSYVPFSAAVAMPVRLFGGDARAWEPLVSLALLAATVVAGVLVASRLYAGSLLRTGGRVKLRQAWSRAES